jgi:hypothetical protein
VTENTNTRKPDDNCATEPVEEKVDVFANEVRDPFGYGNDVPRGAGIGPDGPFGYVEEIHGDLGRPMPGYVPTKHELLLLARHWAEERTDIARFWSDYGQVGSEDMRMDLYASHRLGRISDQVGEEEIRKIYEYVYAFNRPVDPAEVRRWHIEGAGGEVAAAKALGRRRDGQVNTEKEGGVVGHIQVRTRSRYDGLFVRPNDRDDDMLVLVTGVYPTYRVCGWIRGADAKQGQAGGPTSHPCPLEELKNP